MPVIETGQIYPVPSHLWSAAQTARTMNATSTAYSVILPIPRAGTITGIVFNVSTVTSSQSVTGSLQTRDATTGYPTGTNYGGSLPGTLATVATGLNTIALATPATVVKGDQTCAVIAWTSTTGTIGIAGSNPAVSNKAMQFVSGVWGQGPVIIQATLVYSDGSYAETGPLLGTITNNNLFNSGNTPDERGLKWMPRQNFRVYGVSFYGTVAANTKPEFVLYDDTNTAIATTSEYQQGVFVRPLDILFPTPVVLDKTRNYYLMLKPAATNTGIHYIDFLNAAAMTAAMAFYLGSSAIYSSRTDAGAFSDAALRLPFLAPIYDAVSVTSNAPRGYLSIGGGL
jgi:hypothetical protein